MLTALLIKEIRALARDPHALAALFLMPALFIVVMSLALQKLYSPPTNAHRYAIDVRDDTTPARHFAARWVRAHGPAEALPPDWAEAVARGRLDYVLVLEDGFGDALAVPFAPPAPVARIVVEPGVGQGVLRTLEAEAIGQLAELRVVALMGPEQAFAGAGVSIAPFVAVSAAGTKTTTPTAVQQNVPAWLAFGMFFVVTAMASLFIQEQRDGTLTRLLAMGVAPSRLLISKALPYFGINALQAVLMLAVGAALLPLLGGDALTLAGVDWLALGGMLASLSLGAIGFALLVACLVRTHAQANTLGPLLVILMAALGGIMVPTFAMPEPMQALAHASPLNWGLEGLLAVLVRHGAVGDIAPFALRLTLFGLASLALASLLFLRRLRP